MSESYRKRSFFGSEHYPHPKPAARKAEQGADAPFIYGDDLEQLDLESDERTRQWLRHKHNATDTPSRVISGPDERGRIEKEERSWQASYLITKKQALGLTAITLCAANAVGNANPLISGLNSASQRAAYAICEKQGAQDCTAPSKPTGDWRFIPFIVPPIPRFERGKPTVKDKTRYIPWEHPARSGIRINIHGDAVNAFDNKLQADSLLYTAELAHLLRQERIVDTDILSYQSEAARDARSSDMRHMHILYVDTQPTNERRQKIHSTLAASIRDAGMDISRLIDVVMILPDATDNTAIIGGKVPPEKPLTTRYIPVLRTLQAVVNEDSHPSLDHITTAIQRAKVKRKTSFPHPYERGEHGEILTHTYLHAHEMEAATRPRRTDARPAHIDRLSEATGQRGLRQTADGASELLNIALGDIGIPVSSYSPVPSTPSTPRITPKIIVGSVTAEKCSVANSPLLSEHAHRVRTQPFLHPEHTRLMQAQADTR